MTLSLTKPPQWWKLIIITKPLPTEIFQSDYTWNNSKTDPRLENTLIYQREAYNSINPVFKFTETAFYHQGPLLKLIIITSLFRK